jgi:hypothetical protein
MGKERRGEDERGLVWEMGGEREDKGACDGKRERRHLPVKKYKNVH